MWDREELYGGWGKRLRRAAKAVGRSAKRTAKFNAKLVTTPLKAAKKAVRGDVRGAVGSYAEVSASKELAWTKPLANVFGGGYVDAALELGSGGFGGNSVAPSYDYITDDIEPGSGSGSSWVSWVMVGGLVLTIGLLWRR